LICWPIQRETWDKPGTEDIDYTTLDVQHLGSIYEGLLEFQSQIAAELLIETLEDGKPVFKPQREATTPRPIRGQPPHAINAGEAYLVPIAENAKPLAAIICRNISWITSWKIRSDP
jgi:hypothetical protein